MIRERNRGAPYESSVFDALMKLMVDVISVLCFR